MSHYFDPNVAVDVGVNAAILYQNIKNWCDHNRANGRNEHDGLYWTFNSMVAFSKLFPYLSEAQVRQALKVLEAKGYIKSGNFNKVAYDRTKWYADLKYQMQSEESEDSICHTYQMEMISESNGNDTDIKPIPNINTTLNSNITIDKESKPKKDPSRFIPPTIEEVSAYCIERGNSVNPQRFIDHYTSNGWMVGKNKMKDWKAAVRTWERNTIDQKPQVQKKSVNPFDELWEELGYDREGDDPALEEIIGKLPECSKQD